MFGWLKKVGSGAKWLGEGAWWALKRPETQIVISAFWPGALATAAIGAVRIAETKRMTGEEKKAWAISQVFQLAAKHGFKKDADLSKLIEDALAVVEHRAQMLEQ